MAMNMNGYDPEAEDPADPNAPPKSSATSPLVKYGMTSGNTGITGGQPTGNGTGVAPAAPTASTAPASPNVGHDGTYNGMNREQWRDQWMSSGQMSQDQMQQKLTAMGATPTGRGDTWTTPYGETYDLGIGYKTGNPTAGWTAVDGSGGSGAGGSSGGAGGGTGGAGGSGGPGAGAGGDLWSFLMNQMNQSKQVSAQDPIIANQRNAFNAQTTRAGNEYLRQQAEQAGPQGNLAQERRMVAEKAGQAGGQFEAQLMQQELTARRQEIQQALSGALGYLTDQQKMALTRQLAEMDNALQYANLGQRGYEFDQNNLYRNSPLGS